MAPIDVIPSDVPPTLVVGLSLLCYGLFVVGIVSLFACLAADTDASQDDSDDLDEEDRP